MANTVFSGPVKVGDTGSGNPLGTCLESFALALAANAALTTDLTLYLPPCRIRSFSSRTTVAFTGNTVTLSIGSAVGGAQFVAATDIKAKAADTPLVQVAAAADVLDAWPGGLIYLRITQTATATAVGAATLSVTIARADA